MQKIFISYGSGDYRKSLRRIGKEAKKLGLFSRVILYSEKDLPLYIVSSPLKAYPRGDGYWIWKPFIIWKTLQEYPNSIVVYADSGCTLQANYKEWEKWFSLLDEYSAIAFQYSNSLEYPWESELNCKTTEREWTKQSVIDYFNPIMPDSEWLNSEQVLSGLVLACRNSPIIKMWLDISLMRPDLIIDCFGPEIESQCALFLEHRHDQSIWTALCLYWNNQENIVCIIPETAESDPSAAVRATRIHEEPKPPFKAYLVILFKRLFGETFYRKLKFWR